MDRQAWAFTFGILGNIISLMVFLSPLPTFYRVFRRKSTEGFQSTPYVVTLFSCMLWMYYAFLKPGSQLLVTINAVGCGIETLYLAMYLAYAPKSARLLTARLVIGLNVCLFGVIAIATMLLSKGTLRIQVLGWINVAVSLSVFAAPLSIIRLVIRTRSVEFMPFSLSFFLVVSAVIWFMYGMLKRDVFVALPNVLGFVFGVAQMALYMAYRNTTPRAGAAAAAAQEIKLPEHVKEVAGGKVGGAAEGRISCGAEVHPIDVLPPTSTEPAAHDCQVIVDADDETKRPDHVAEAADVARDEQNAILRPEQIIKPDVAIAVEV